MGVTESGLASEDHWSPSHEVSLAQRSLFTGVGEQSHTLARHAKVLGHKPAQHQLQTLLQALAKANALMKSDHCGFQKLR